MLTRCKNPKNLKNLKAFFSKKTSFFPALKLTDCWRRRPRRPRRRPRWKLLGAPPPPVVRRPNAAAGPLVIGAQLSSSVFIDLVDRMYTSVVCVICQILLYQFLKVCLRTFFKLIRQKSKIVPVTTGIVVMVVFDVIAALVCVCYSQQHCYNNHHC